MFRKKKDKDVDISSLNEILAIGRKVIKIGYIMGIISLVLLVTYLLKEWKILPFVRDFLVVISPIFIGLIIAWLCDPIVGFLEKKKVPRIVGCIFVYLVIIGALFLLLYLLLPTFVNQIKDFVGTIPDILKDIKHFVNGIFDTFNSRDLNINTIKDQMYHSIEKFGTGLTTNLPDMLLNMGKSLVSGSMTFVLGLMIGFYMLFDFHKINHYLLKMMPKSWEENYQELGTRINESLRSYVQGVFFVMLLVFITQSIGLSLAGLKAPLIFALFCALTDIIPYFGPYIGAIPAIIVGFTMSPVVGIFCIVSILVVQLLENNFYQPLIMGHTMKLHPVTIMISLLLFQHFFGIIGMIVATPVVACLKVIVTFINEKLHVGDRVTGETTLSI